MLITTCTHCLARFRVTPQQLNLRQGQVRCGHCNKVFSGFEALERFPDDSTGSRILAARAAAAASPGSSGSSASETGRSAPFDSIPLDQLPEIAAAEDDRPEAAPGALPEIDAAEDDRPEVPLEEKLRPAKPEPAPAARAWTRSPALNLLTLPEPEPTAPLSRAWIFGCVLLGLVFAMQVVYAMRAQVAQNYPMTRPWLESVCAKAGCNVPWVNDPQLLKLEDSELLEVPGRPSEIALGARIRNLAPHAQEFPHLELTLTDLTGQAAARRVLRPADYLGRAPVTGEVMSAGSELAVQMRLDTPRIKATGYELLLFYP